MELRHLRYFIAVAEEQNFTRAAERVHIDQTPLSRAVRDLEEELEVQLFLRESRQLRITPAGTRLLDEARKIFIRIERTKRVVRMTHSLYQAPLRVGVADGIAQQMLSDCFTRWKSVVPEIPLELKELRARELASALRREELDVGFSFGVPQDDTIAQDPAWHYRLMAVLPSTHELASSAVVSISVLLSFPLLACSEQRMPGLFVQMQSIVRRYTERATIVGAADTAPGYVTRIASGVGVGLGDEGHTQTLLRNDVVVAPLAEDERITTYVLYKRQRFGLAEPVQRFLTHVSTLS
ncbi:MULTISPECIES: LysR family transcriptional regulator [Acidovorax]|uniref:LysR family transcriptional regulator n=1 Tax=Acidovorax facilis TaxID=12917 RepID=A0ABV8DDZ0_9BURK|nr:MULTISPECIES: LysR family transcriptional regulator [Acidovorax]MCO4245060.1 LysR family transcriptional regulator [Acidovorax facilis]